MLEKKSKFLLPSNTRGKAESSKDFRKLSPVMGRKCARPPACLLTGGRGSFTLGSGLFCIMDGCLTPISPLRHRSHCALRLIFIFSLPYLFLDRVLVCSSGLHRTDRYRPTSTFQVLGGLCPTTANLGLGFLNHASR